MNVGIDECDKAGCRVFVETPALIPLGGVVEGIRSNVKRHGFTWATREVEGKFNSAQKTHQATGDVANRLDFGEKRNRFSFVMKMTPFVADPKKEVLLEEAILVAETVFALSVSTKTKKRVFDSTMWWVSERHGKYSTRFRTSKSLLQTTGLRHDHVFPRKQLWDMVERGANIRETLSFCVGCVVTSDEHSLLSQTEKKCSESYGWLRYKNAGIEVIDCLTGVALTTDSMCSMSERFIELYRASRFIGIADDFEP